MSDKTGQYIKRYTGNTNMIYSDAGESDTVSDTDYPGGINNVYFLTNGALKGITCTEGYIINSSDIDSGTTITAGSVLYLKDASKVKTSTHGAQMIYLNE